MNKKDIDKAKQDLVNDKEKTKHWGLKNLERFKK
tara:strand:- start:1620 stop:1721 length:102 start_codon:yes stop_codon:yes gene_type:complete